jgi:hypothetical protein
MRQMRHRFWYWTGSLQVSSNSCVCSTVAVASWFAGRFSVQHVTLPVSCQLALLQSAQWQLHKGFAGNGEFAGGMSGR